MKIVFVRHGEPDYQNDTLTQKGWREAELLAERISKWNVTDFYCSPLGRAQDTASCTLKKINRSAVTYPWLREFSYPVDDPVTGRHSIPWDLVPSYWSSDPLMHTQNDWTQTDIMKQNPEIHIQYHNVCQNFDQLLEGYGYFRDNSFYRRPDQPEKFIATTVAADGTPAADKLPSDPNEPLIVIFCHLGVTCLILSHLLNIPFPLLAHGFFMPTTSLTVLSSEERWSNEAYFRIQTTGDVSHLLGNNEPVSSAGSFAKAFQG